jgi:hypothetical protein
VKGETAFGGEVVWHPSSEYTDHAHLTQFIQYHNLPDFEALMVRSWIYPRERLGQNGFLGGK